MSGAATTRSPEGFGRYELLTLLARGGMADVFLARRTAAGGFEKLVVVKRMLPHLGEDPEFVELFLNEGRIAARLDHPNICQVFDSGEIDGLLFLVMEYLDGLAWADLVTEVPRGNAVELRVAAGVLGQICDGLQRAHELRDVDGTLTPVVHRDVSPHNLFVTRTGVCKLLDFGVSKVLTDATRTRSGGLKGKLPYMAPEQIRGERIDPRADVFSLGVVLWEALTGKRLFHRDTDYLIWRAITEDAIPDVTTLRSDLPHEIDAVVTRALERDREHRYPNAHALASDLRQVADRVGGAFSPRELAELLQTAAAAKLDARASLVTRALGRSAPASPASRPTGEHGSDVALRTRSVRLGRPRRPHRQRVALAVGVAVVATSLAVVAVERGAPEATRATPASAAPITPITAPTNAVDPPSSSPAPTPAPAPSSARDTRSNHRASPRMGTYSIDSTPYATIYIDGSSYGDTPLFKAPLAAGMHRVRAVLADGRAKQLTVSIQPGKIVSSGTLQW